LPYTKRWWTKELTALRKAYNRAHRAIVKDDAISEANGLLSLNQFGGRSGRSTVDALLTALTQRVNDAWRVGKVGSALLRVHAIFVTSVNLEEVRHVI
jgi:hypothetical protein